MEQHYAVTGERSLEPLEVIRRCVGALQERAGGSSLWEHELLEPTAMGARLIMASGGHPGPLLARAGKITTVELGLLAGCNQDKYLVVLQAWHVPRQHRPRNGVPFATPGRSRRIAPNDPTVGRWTHR